MAARVSSVARRGRNNRCGDNMHRGRILESSGLFYRRAPVSIDRVVSTLIESPLGPMVAGAAAQGICLLEFTDRRRLAAQLQSVRARFDCAVVADQSPHFDLLRDQLHGYFSGKLRGFSVPLAAPGTPFQERVWGELLRIPFGETRSYEDLARAVGLPGGQRAVGRANGLNRIAILIPCHRVINKSGKLGGYGGLLWRKEALLHLERTGRLAASLPFSEREHALPAGQSAG